MSVWVLRILFLSMSVVGGYAVSQVRPELIENGLWGALVGFGFGGLLIAVDEMVKGFSLRAFSAASFGLLLGTVIALLIDNSGLFDFADKPVRWLIRLCIFLGFGYIGMILAMRSNKEDFYLIIPFVRFASQSRPDSMLVLDTSVIIDGRIADLIEGNVLEGTIVVPRFVLKELQFIADSSDAIRRARGRRGLETLRRIQRNTRKLRGKEKTKARASVISTTARWSWSTTRNTSSDSRSKFKCKAWSRPAPVFSSLPMSKRPWRLEAIANPIVSYGTSHRLPQFQ